VLALLLLALVAFGSGGRTITGDKVVSSLWPQADGEMGMRALYPFGLARR